MKVRPVIHPLVGVALPTALLLTTAVTGCKTDLGQCDPDAARVVVYDPAGMPHYAGQALVQEACAGGLCHSSTAEGDARVGVPAELDFDVPVVDGDADMEVQAASAKQLGLGLATVRDWLESMYEEVDDGAMPPGEAGMRAKRSWGASDGMGGSLPADEQTVPSIESDAGKEMLRNWLACGAPVISGTPGVSEAVIGLGDAVVPKANNTAPVEATWESIYEQVINAKCTVCHNANVMSAFPDTDLDLSAGSGAAADVVARLVDQDAFSGGPCAGEGTLVVAGDCAASLFYTKLAAAADGSDVCGESMPLLSGALSSAELDAICEWIDAGATP